MPPRTVVTVLLDDTKTALGYFRVLREDLRGRVHLDLHPAPRQGATPAQLAEAAGLLAARADKDAQPVWCVVDLEGSLEQEARVDNAFASPLDRGVTLIRSQPCFELWTLLYFTDTGSAFDNCAQVLSELKRHWLTGFQQANNKKAQLPYGEIIDRRNDAAARARRQREHAQSWTEVSLLIEEIDRLDAASRSPSSG